MSEQQEHAPRSAAPCAPARLYGSITLGINNQAGDLLTVWNSHTYGGGWEGGILIPARMLVMKTSALESSFLSCAMRPCVDEQQQERLKS